MRTGYSFLIILAYAGPALGLTVQLGDANPGESAAILYSAGDSAPFELIVDLANELAASTQPIFLWQLQLQLQSQDGATGAIEFEMPVSVEDSLFGSDTGLLYATETPSAELVVSDGDSEFTGVAISAHSRVPVIKLVLLPSIDAEGFFRLTMSPLDPDDIDHSSMWQTEELTPLSFDNSISQSPRFEIALIHVSQSGALMGDFNNDHFVDAADFTVWRDGLGSTYSPNDYDLWKLNFGESDLGVGGTYSVPEPSTISLIVVGAILGTVILRRQNFLDRTSAPCSSHIER